MASGCVRVSGASGREEVTPDARLIEEAKLLLAYDVAWFERDKVRFAPDDEWRAACRLTYDAAVALQRHRDDEWNTGGTK